MPRPEIGLQFNHKNHPVQTALALVWTPLLSLRAGGEMSSTLQYAPTPALEKFQKENEKENGNEFSLVSSSPRLLITSSPHPYYAHNL